MPGRGAKLAHPKYGGNQARAIAAYNKEKRAQREAAEQKKGREVLLSEMPSSVEDKFVPKGAATEVPASMAPVPQAVAVDTAFPEHVSPILPDAGIAPVPQVMVNNAVQSSPMANALPSGYAPASEFAGFYSNAAGNTTANLVATGPDSLVAEGTWTCCGGCLTTSSHYIVAAGNYVRLTDQTRGPNAFTLMWGSVGELGIYMVFRADKSGFDWPNGCDDFMRRVR